MAKYQIPIIVTVEADSYEKAIREVQYWESGDWTLVEALTNREVVTSFEHDNEGQRVLYLHPEDSPIDE